MLNNNFLVKLNNLHESNFLILRRLLQYQTPCLVVVVRNPKELYHLNRIRLHRLSFSQNTYVGYIVFPNGFRSLYNFLVLLYCPCWLSSPSCLGDDLWWEPAHEASMSASLYKYADNAKRAMFTVVVGTLMVKRRNYNKRSRGSSERAPP